MASRDGWQVQWQEQMLAPVCRRQRQALLMAGDCLGLLKRGRALGRDIFLDFLNVLSQSYRGGISSPLKAPSAGKAAIVEKHGSRLLQTKRPQPAQQKEIEPVQQSLEF